MELSFSYTYLLPNVWFLHDERGESIEKEKHNHSSACMRLLSAPVREGIDSGNEGAWYDELPLFLGLLDLADGRLF